MAEQQTPPDDSAVAPATGPTEPAVDANVADTVGRAPGAEVDQSADDELLKASSFEDVPPLDGEARSAVAPPDAPANLSTAPDDPSNVDEAVSAAPVADPDQAAIDELLKSASFEDVTSSEGAAIGSLPGGAMGPTGGAGAPDAKAPMPLPIDLPNLQQIMQEAQVSSIDLLRDVELNVKIELGRSRMLVEDVLRLSEGSVVELDKLAGDPVDVFVNDRLVARGEVLVLNDNFCVRVNEIVNGSRVEAS